MSYAVGFIVVLGNLLPHLIKPFSSNSSIEHGGSSLTSNSLFRLRLLFIGLFVFTIYYEVTFSHTFTVTDPEGWLKFFTNWSWCAFGLSSLIGVSLSQANMPKLIDSGEEDLGVLHLGAGAGKGRDVESGARIDRATSPAHDLISKAYGRIFVTAICSQFVVVIFYWGLSSSVNYNLDNVIRHGAGPICLAIELSSTRLAVSSSSLPYVIGFPSLYLVYMILRGRRTGDWVYGELNPDRPHSLMYYSALVLLILGSFTLVYYLAKMREKLQLRRLQEEWKEGSKGII
jgi:hypothetical protein